MKIKLQNGLTAFLLGAIILAPTYTFADNGKSKDKQEVKIVKSEKSNDNNRDDDDKKANKKCRVAYGHLISFGWLKKNSKVEIDGDCILPFSIAKKFRGNASSTPTVDTTKPIISNIVSTTTSVRAVINWNTDERSDSTVFWSTSNVDVNNPNTSRISDSDRVLNHRLAINGLSANTTYNAIVRSRDKAGNITYSSQFSFTTKSPSVLNDTTSPTIHSIVAIVSTSTVKVGWQTNEPATSKIYFGTSSPLSLTASSTHSIETLPLSNVHLLEAKNLSTSTNYYIVVESHDAAGNTQKSDQFQITTSN